MITTPTPMPASAPAAAAPLARSEPAAPAPARRRAPSTPARTPARALATAPRTAAPARRRRTGSASGAGYAGTVRASAAKAPATKASGGSSAASGPLAFLKDPKLPIEEKLMRLLGYLNAKWEKEMQQKLDAIAGGGGTKTASASGSSAAGAKKKSGGFLDSLGSVGKFVQSVVAPAKAALEFPLVREVLKQVGGPALAAGATALGFPQLAPVLLKYGPELVDQLSSLASSLDAGPAPATSTASSSSGTKASSGGSGAVSDAERQTLVLEIQRIQQKQQEMFGLVSNILKSGHDTRLAMVNNIR